MSGASPPPLPIWLDGRILEGPLAGPSAWDSAVLEGRGCYSTARIRGGRPRFLQHHVDRLLRDARTLGLGGIDPAAVREALVASARAAFGAGDGIVRLQASRDARGVHLLAIPRPLGPEPALWRAAVAPVRHPGPMAWGGAKITGHLAAALARDAAREAGLDEGLLLDASGHLVEGGRSNLLYVEPDGELRVVDPALGAVAGVGLEVLRERRSGPLGPGRLHRSALPRLRELVAVNAVRGARPVVEVDGVPVGDGEAGPLARELDALLERD